MILHAGVPMEDISYFTAGVLTCLFQIIIVKSNLQKPKVQQPGYRVDYVGPDDACAGLNTVALTLSDESSAYHKKDNFFPLRIMDETTGQTRQIEGVVEPDLWSVMKQVIGKSCTCTHAPL